MAIKESSGNWKENLINQKLPKACSAIKKIMGDEWTTFINGNGIQSTRCPILPVKT